jgi:hypothetical protein
MYRVLYQWYHTTNGTMPVRGWNGPGPLIPYRVTVCERWMFRTPRDNVNLYTYLHTDESIVQKYRHKCGKHES